MMLQSPTPRTQSLTACLKRHSGLKRYDVRSLDLARRAWPAYLLTMVISIIVQEGVLRLGAPLKHTVIIAPMFAVLLVGGALLLAHLTTPNPERTGDQSRE